MTTHINSFSVPHHIYMGWQRVGGTEGLSTDADIATFLVQLYEKSQSGGLPASVCVHCQIPLSLFCGRCQLISQQTQATENAASNSNKSRPPPSPDENSSNIDAWGGNGTDVTTNPSFEDMPLASAFQESAEVKYSKVVETSDRALSQTNSEDARIRTSEEVWSGTSVDDCVKDERLHTTNTEPKQQQAKQKSAHMKTSRKRKAGMQAEHTKPKTKTVCLCYICGASIKQYRLKCHLRTHTGERPYQCGVCGASFSTIQILKRHGSTHTEEKPYTCNICGASYKELSGLWYHMKRHKGDKPYKCTHCPMTFIKPLPLKIHLRTHTGEHPFECPVCHKKFKSKGRMKKHIERRLKTGETPCLDPSSPPKGYSERHRFACPMCPKKFTTSSHLKQHRERKLKDGRMPCKQL